MRNGPEQIREDEQEGRPYEHLEDATLQAEIGRLSGMVLIAGSPHATILKGLRAEYVRRMADTSRTVRDMAISRNFHVVPPMGGDECEPDMTEHAEAVGQDAAVLPEAGSSPDDDPMMRFRDGLVRFLQTVGPEKGAQILGPDIDDAPSEMATRPWHEPPPVPPHA